MIHAVSSSVVLDSTAVDSITVSDSITIVLSSTVVVHVGDDSSLLRSSVVIALNSSVDDVEWSVLVVSLVL